MAINKQLKEIFADLDSSITANTFCRALNFILDAAEKDGDFGSEMATADEAMESLGISNQTLWRYVTQGELPMVKRGNKRWFKKSDLEKFKRGEPF